MTHVWIACQQQHPRVIGMLAEANLLLMLLFGAHSREFLVQTNTLRWNSQGRSVGWQGLDGNKINKSMRLVSADQNKQNQ